MMDRLDQMLNFHQTALRVRSQRQELLAANIANADTPNFKARDIDFAATMKSALTARGGNSVSTAVTDGAHLQVNADGTQAGGQAGEALFRPIMQNSVDGNSVDMDVERSQFTDNAIRYEASLVMLNGQLKKMLAAIQGQ